MAPTGERSRATTGLVLAGLGLLVTIAGSMVTLAYHAGGIVGGVRSIGASIEKIDARLGRVEGAQANQATDIAVIKAQLGAPQPTVVTRAAPRR